VFPGVSFPCAGLEGRCEVLVQSSSFDVGPVDVLRVTMEDQRMTTELCVYFISRLLRYCFLKKCPRSMIASSAF
jgi:hypothetical protein